MSDQITLAVDTRETLGKGVKRLRKDGLVPGVIHDHGKASVHIQAEYQALHKVFTTAGKHHPVEISADGKKYTTIIKSVTFDPKYNALTHIVFGAIKANEKVDAEIPVHPAYDEGNDSSPAERTGLIVLAQTTHVNVKALPKDLPDALTYDAERLVAVGDQITVADLRVPAGVEIETEPEHVVATVFEPSALAAANDDAGGSAQASDQTNVEADHESGATEGTQADELRPGGKEQKESKDEGRNPEKQ
ncbi:MAG TPA: 50S ribosomal protein L25 [Candidatus Saccharimonadales bacterium]|nr:50S ribosomal protein L25 [Candidatus Saccharimonadales bacterium]